MSLRSLRTALGVIALCSASPEVVAAEPAPSAPPPLPEAAPLRGPQQQPERDAAPAASASQAPSNTSQLPSSSVVVESGAADSPTPSAGLERAETAAPQAAKEPASPGVATDPSRPSWSSEGHPSVADATPTSESVGSSTIDLWAGLRNTLVTGSGFDAFAENDSLAQLSLGAGVTLDSDPGYAIAAVGFWDLGGRSASFRGQESELGSTRLALGPELRLPLIPRLYLLGRATPLAVRWAAEVDPGVTGALTDSGWTFGAEAAVGVAFALAQVHQAGASAFGLWVRAEGGYSWAAAFTPELGAGSDAPLRTADLELEEVALRGAQFRIAAGFSL